jgi:adsorption protein B
MGLRLKRIGARSRFLRVRGLDRRLVATRAYFPATLTGAIRQKTRWVHGIALQGWDRTGWEGRLAEIWMRLRDRRGPLAALVLASAYLLLIVSGAAFLLDPTGRERAWIDDPLIQGLLIANFIGFAWRAAMRFAFTTREYGWGEGVRAVLRIPIANIIAIVAGRRALFAYVRTLSGHKPEWDKTAHRAYPAGWLGEQGRSDPIPPAAIAQAAAIPATP